MIARRVWEITIALSNVCAILATDWTHAEPFPCPATSKAHCSASQRDAYRFEDVVDGPLSRFGSNDFHGFHVSRGLLTAHESMGTASTDTAYVSGLLRDFPSMTAVNHRFFSITKLRVSTSVDAEVQVVFGMADGSTCTQTHPCSPDASILRNSQCGGTLRRNSQARTIDPKG